MKFNKSIIMLVGLTILLTLFLMYKPTKETYTGNLRVENDKDKKLALKYALKKVCEKRGYKWIEGGDEFTYDCKHTEETCKRDSVYPTKEGAIPQYFEWRASNSSDAKDVGSKTVNIMDGRPQSLSKSVGQSSLSESENDINNEDAGGLCILGNERFRSFCEENGLTYNPDDGSCVTNRKYCNNRCLPFCNGDCYLPPDSWAYEQIFGATLSRSFGCARNMTLEGVCSAVQKTN